MSVLEKIKNNKRYHKVYNILKVLMFIPVFLIPITSFSGLENSLLLMSSNFKLQKINQDIELIKDDIIKEEENIIKLEDIELIKKDIIKEEENIIELEEKENNNKMFLLFKKSNTEYNYDIIKEKETILASIMELEEKEKNNNLMLLLLISIFGLIVTMIFISRNKYNKTILKKEDFIELLKMDKIYEKQYIDYMNIINIHDLFDDNNHLKETHNLINEKDWLLKRVKHSKLFKELLNKNEFKEYLALFNDDYIKKYFKEEIEVIKKENKSINFLLNEKSEKEIFQIINI